jgi:hypothetical protein
LNSFLYRVRDRHRDLASVFYLWISSCTNTTCFPGYFLYLCKKSYGYTYGGLFLELIFYCIGQLAFFSASTMLIDFLLCFFSTILSQVLYYLQIALALRIALSILSCLCFCVNVRIYFSISVKNDIGILWGLH